MVAATQWLSLVSLLFDRISRLRRDIEFGATSHSRLPDKPFLRSMHWLLPFNCAGKPFHDTDWDSQSHPILSSTDSRLQSAMRQLVSRLRFVCQRVGCRESIFRVFLLSLSVTDTHCGSASFSGCNGGSARVAYEYGNTACNTIKSCYKPHRMLPRSGTRLYTLDRCAFSRDPTGLTPSTSPSNHMPAPLGTPSTSNFEVRNMKLYTYDYEIHNMNYRRLACSNSPEASYY